MVSIPEIRESIIQWALNRDFIDVKTIPYPAEEIGQTLTQDMTLVIFTKALRTGPSVTPSGVPVSAPAKDAVSDRSSDRCDEGADAPPSPLPPPVPPGSVALPPHWRVGTQPVVKPPPNGEDVNGDAV